VRPIGWLLIAAVCGVAIGCILQSGLLTPRAQQIEDWCDELRIRSALYDWCLKGGCGKESRVRYHFERVRVGIELCGAQIKSAQKPARTE
jgi:hypothetical protein